MGQKFHFRSLKSKLNPNFMGNLQKENTSVIVVACSQLF
jgi:hypothetical protein